jgi:hypothetical protein
VHFRYGDSAIKRIQHLCVCAFFGIVPGINELAHFAKTISVKTYRFTEHPERHLNGHMRLSADFGNGVAYTDAATGVMTLGAALPPLLRPSDQHVRCPQKVSSCGFYNAQFFLCERRKKTRPVGELAGSYSLSKELQPSRYGTGLRN